MLTFKPPGVWSWLGLCRDHLLLQIVNSLTTWGLSPPRAGSQRTFPPAELSQRHPWPSSDVQPSKSQFHPAWKEELWLQWKKMRLNAWIGGSVGAGVVGVGVEGTEKRQKWLTMDCHEKNEFWRNKIVTCWRNCGRRCARFRIGLARCVCEYYILQLQNKNVVVSMILIMMEQTIAFQGLTYKGRQMIKSWCHPIQCQPQSPH